MKNSEAYVTKKEVEELTSMNRRIVKIIQDYFIKKFNFKKVDSEYLELKLNGNLLELRIFAFPDDVYMTLIYFDNIYRDRENSMKDVEYVYKLVKTIIKRERGK